MPCLEPILMPVKIRINGRAVGYNLSNYQQNAKAHLRSSESRTYSIKPKHKNAIIDAAVFASYYTPKTHALCFGTFSYRNVINSITNQVTLDGQTNPLYNDNISEFFHYARSKLGSTGFIWTKELTEQGMVHYHSIFSLPWNVLSKRVNKQGIALRLNDLWANYSGQRGVKNCFRTDSKKGLVIKDLGASVAYAAKYSAKAEGFNKWKSPVYRISNTWQCKPVGLGEYRDKALLTLVDKKQVALSESCYEIETKHALLFAVDKSFAKFLHENLEHFRKIDYV